MRASYESANKRHAKKHALGIVAVANKMNMIIWHVLTDKTPHMVRNEKLHRQKLARMEKAR